MILAALYVAGALAFYAIARWRARANPRLAARYLPGQLNTALTVLAAIWPAALVLMFIFAVALMRSGGRSQ